MAPLPSLGHGRVALDQQTAHLLGAGVVRGLEIVEDLIRHTPEAEGHSELFVATARDGPALALPIRQRLKILEPIVLLSGADLEIVDGTSGAEI